MDAKYSSSQARFVLSALLGLSMLFLTADTEGQVATSITNSVPKDLGDARNLGTQITTSGATTTIKGGTQSGSNLFHSFGDFSVGTGHTANYLAPGAVDLSTVNLNIANVINRVTGQSISNIDGIINSKTAMPNASFFLINPNGLVVGPNASFNVGESLHLSSADYLRLTDGTKFFASLDPSKQSTLTSAEVAAFGFLASRISEATLTPILKAADDQTLSLIGRDISINGRRVQASGGQIDVVSVLSGEVSLTANGPQFSPGTTFGNISLTAKPPDAISRFSTGSELNTNTLESGKPAGDIFIRGGHIVIENSGVYAFAQASSGSDNPNVATGGNIVVAGDSLTLSQADLVARTAGPSGAGPITLQGQDILLQNNTKVSAESILGFGHPGGTSENGGRAGSITIRGLNGPAQNVAIIDNSKVSTAVGSGEFKDNPPAGINITSQAVTLDHATITSDTTGASPAGNITLEGKTVDIANGSLISSNSTYSTKSYIFTRNTFDLAGSAGSITIRGQSGEGSFAQTVNLNNSTVRTTIDGGNSKTAPATIRIAAAALTLANGAQVTAETSGGAVGGNISLSSGSNNIVLTNSSISTTASQSSGGNIDLTAPNMVLLHDSQITTSVTGGAGSGGDIVIARQFEVLENNKILAQPTQSIVLQNSNILAQATQGSGGAIFLVAGVLLSDPASVINADSKNQTLNGTVNIQAPIQQLSGAIAPLPQAFAVATNLYGQRCATEKGGQFSSFVEGARDGVPPQPGDLIPSPLLLESEGASSSLGLQSFPSLVASRLGLPTFEQVPHSLTVFAGCRS
jgi:filamentous hemagglutinin family protein